MIGGGLAGCEAAWQLARRGLPVRLYEMRPRKMTAAHQGGGLAELVCSNSLRASAVSNAVGLLKEELRRLHSLVMAAADATAVPAGAALAVDRQAFSAYIETAIAACPLIELRREEVTELPEQGICIIAAGPLASEALSAALSARIGGQYLYFHDAIAPIIDAESIDMSVAFFASRYGKGAGDDYLNCPLDKQQYLRFYQALLEAELHPLHGFEQQLFEGCMPVEALARRGVDTLRFGPLKPVGLPLAGGREAYAVVQLRKENAHGSAYNMVGFQTRLTYGEQRRVFRLIPGLEQAEFFRLGSMHRNTYVNAPLLLDEHSRLKSEPRLYVAGQLSGVEGYVESAASGLAAGVCAAAELAGREPPRFPRQTALGSLLAYLHTAGSGFQPSNINFGLMPPLTQRIRNKQEKNAVIAERALSALAEFCRVNDGA